MVDSVTQELTFFQSILNQIKSYALSSGVKLVSAILIIVIGFKLTNMLCKKISKGKGFNRIDVSAQAFIRSFINIAVKVILLLTAAALIGVPMTNIVAILGSCGLAIGLALQGSLSNFAGGLMLIIFKPFKVGDYISAISNEGTVTEITILYTHILTIDNKEITIPNGALSNATVINYSAKDTRRVDIEIGVAYDSDIDFVKKNLKQVADNCVYKLEASVVDTEILSFDDSAITLCFRVWVKSKDYWPASFALKSAIDKQFKENNISIPFPQTDVHLIQE